MVTVFLTNGNSIDIAGGNHTEYKENPTRLQIRDEAEGDILAVFYPNNIAGYELVEEIIGEYNE